MPKAAIDMTGQRVNRLVVVARSEATASSGAALWVCHCDCGNTTVYAGPDLRRGQVKSCGCWDKEATAQRATTHGRSGTPEHRTWMDMRRRCRNPNRRDFAHYGGRGIRVCPEWENFEVFLADMGQKPDPSYIIDRVDPDGDYCPENCRWQPRTEMNDNKRSSRLIAFNGRAQALGGWCRELGLNYYRVHSRLKRGASIAEAFGE